MYFKYKWLYLRLVLDECHKIAMLLLMPTDLIFQAVFKNYDHDKDGFISHDEFKAIAGNFPFIDSFCVLDADQ